MKIIKLGRFSLIIGFLLFSTFFIFSSKTASRLFAARAQNDAEIENSPKVVGGEIDFPKEVCLTDEKRAEIQLRLQTSIDTLRAEGKLVEQESFMFAPQQFIFPVRGNGAAVNDYGVHGISNFVDQNLSFPNQLLDYNCGMRTYDQSSGYNHAGTDIFTFPFGWNKMDNNEAVAIAAADGQIIYKSDGNFDRSCGFNNNNWNAVYLRHADGTVSWNGHLKLNSLTTKPVGATVSQGEYLGVVGSSGNSTGPHLHFEVYNAGNQLQDPYQGTCNTKNNFSYWVNQPAYRDSKINKLMTHSAAPVFPSCPQPEIPNAKDVFAPGSQLIVAAYYRDQVAGQTSQLSLVQPNGAVYQSWSHSSPSTYNASYWYWTLTLPANAQTGSWKFRVAYQSQTYEHTFSVGTGNSALFDYDGDAKSDISVFNASNGMWHFSNSMTGYREQQFANSGDKIVPADYDGDGKTDIAVYRPSNGVWYLLRSQLGYIDRQFGEPGDVPVPADYDGDGKADFAVYRPSNGVWYLLRSTLGFTQQQFGGGSYQPIAADYDGDKKTDIAVYLPSNGVWYILRSSLGYVDFQFGGADYKPVAADYDGDGKADFAVYLPANGVWYMSRSQLGYKEQQFGGSEYKPVPADYDGDGKTDVAVYLPSNGVWYLSRSTAGFTQQQFGGTVFTPTVSAFLP